jgi:transcriptional regulator with XRE-family HTH domain
LREEQNLGLRELARAAGVHHETLRQIELDTPQAVTLDVLLRIQAALRVPSIEVLLGSLAYPSQNLADRASPPGNEASPDPEVG